MNSLRSKIVVFFITLVIAIIAITLMAVLNKTKDQAYESIERELHVASRVFSEKLQSRQELLQNAGNAISKDFYFQSLFSDSLENSEEVVSFSTALLNQQKRAGADLSIAFDEDGEIIASSQDDLASKLSFDITTLGNSKVKDRDPILVVVDGKAFQIVISPVKAPLTIGWLALGYSVDQELLNYIKSLTNIETTLSYIPQTNENILIASTLNSAELTQFLEPEYWVSIEAETSLFITSGKQYLSLNSSFKTTSQTKLIAYFQRDVQDALLDFKALRSQITAIALVSILFAILGALTISGSITRPIRELVAIAKKIGGGEYGLPILIKDKGETGILAREFSNMQERIASREKEINYLAFHDSFTNLPNRNNFQRHLDQLIEGVDADLDSSSHSNSFVVLAVNLDRLREINDTLGHRAGDELVKLFGERLQSLSSCSLCSIIGTDQFFLCFPEKSVQQVEDLKTSIHELASQPIVVQSVALDLHARVGAVIYPEHGETPNELMQRVDIAVSFSEKHNRFFSLYDPALDEHSLETLALMSELRSAIGRNELTLYYQPKLDIKTNIITHVECLVRWIHPTQGFVNPDQFIPYAEQTGSIRVLTRWVLETAIAQHIKWLSLGWNIKVAVNISTVDLLDPSLPEFLSELLARHEVNPDCLVLEITESAVMSDTERALETLDRFSKAGIKLSIDDYGTGYSSMTQLKRLTVDELKIDKSFVMELPGSKEDEIIVRSTIELGHNMGLMVVAEGVESEEALQCLRNWGCDIAQGYYINRPAPYEQLNEWLSEAPFPINRAHVVKQENAGSS